MPDISYPFEYEPNAHGTELSFSGKEDGHFVVEVNVASLRLNQRIRLTFQGAPWARINDPFDCDAPSDSLVVEMLKTPWLDEHRRAYVKKAGESRLSNIEDLRHYVVHGHDLTIGILARKVECKKMV